ncbi:helix-turn-helix transcriptional regulator [Olivibacter jilunii]|jgi:hypothetical protein|uniref:helix-turn-helix transcriptional regulator n=1 Tax=Olivibacter jilunii TaxID=985016 RepID=UPI003F15EBC4
MTQFDRIIQLLELIRQSINVLAERQALQTLVEIADEQLQIMRHLKEQSMSYGSKHNADSTLMTKQEVLAYLNISDSTYKRRVREGLLKPMRLGGGDVFYKEDLQQALWESKRKGKI